MAVSTPASFNAGLPYCRYQKSHVAGLLVSYAREFLSEMRSNEYELRGFHRLDRSEATL